MEEKLKFVTLARTGRFTITELCDQCGINRKTGHKYLLRYAQSGSVGLNEHSRRPKGSPGATDPTLERLILGERRRHPTWGPKKLRVLLERNHGIESPPARSTIGLILTYGSPNPPEWDLCWSMDVGGPCMFALG